MAEFLKAFIPTVAFMLVPVAIPVLAIVAGTVRDLMGRESRAVSVDDRVRAHVADRDVATQAA